MMIGQTRQSSVASQIKTRRRKRQQASAFMAVLQFLWKNKKPVFIIILILITFNFIKSLFSDNKPSSRVSTSDTTYVSPQARYSESNYDAYIDEIIDKIHNKEFNGVLDSYSNIGMIKCDGYVNLRSEPDENNTRNIIGKLVENVACEILENPSSQNKDYAKIISGGMTGYVATRFLVTGDAAKQLAKENIKKRAIVLVDKLWMRSKPEVSSDTELTAAFKGERYAIKERVGDWFIVEADNMDDVSYAYISADSSYVAVEYCLNAARTQNLRNDVIKYYDNLGVSTTKSYLNIRKTAKDNGTIIGKLPSKGGCEILGTEGNWYKIKSGLVTGYVNKQYIATGKKAEELAVQYADLRAIVKIAAMKVRTGPGTKYKQWTTITREESYLVEDQLDGWVKIEIDGGEGGKDNFGYVSTSKNYVEVRYALDQAIEWKVSAAAPAGVSKTRTDLKAYAIQFIGNPYLWGGTSLTNGADCSGFVQSIFKKYGVSLPRTSRDQVKKGTKVTSKDMKIGDLIFYTNSAGVVDHVAIYIGNNQIVHAASARAGIRISKWNYRTPYAIRNVLGK